MTPPNLTSGRAASYVSRQLKASMHAHQDAPEAKLLTMKQHTSMFVRAARCGGSLLSCVPVAVVVPNSAPQLPQMRQRQLGALLSESKEQMGRGGRGLGVSLGWHRRPWTRRSVIGFVPNTTNMEFGAKPSTLPASSKGVRAWQASGTKGS
jgi:hypothetical protein